MVVLEKNKPLTGRKSGDVLIRRFVLFISISLWTTKTTFVSISTTLKNNAYPVCLNVTPGGNLQASICDELGPIALMQPGVS